MSRFIPWVGGKSHLADKIVRMFPKHVGYVEPFIGGGSVFFSKYPSKTEIINDINKELMTLYRVVKNHKEEFYRQFEMVLISRDEFDRLKATPPETLTDIQRAARFFYMVKNCYSGKLLSQVFGTSAASSSRLNIDKIDEIIYQVHGRLSNVTIENLPYEDLIPRYDRPDTLFYLDPPYHGCENFYGKGIFNKDDYARLGAILHDLKGKFILSINDDEFIREIFKDFEFVETQVTYSIGANKGHKAPELIYRNF